MHIYQYRNWVSRRAPRGDSTINMKMITQFPSSRRLRLCCLHEYFISRCYPYHGSWPVRVWMWIANHIKRIKRTKVERERDENGLSLVQMGQRNVRREKVKRNKKFIKVASHSPEWAFKALIGVRGVRVSVCLRCAAFWVDKENEDGKSLTRKWLQQLCNFRINFNFIPAVICFSLPSLRRSVGLLLVTLEACMALPNCKAEKAINHMRKIKNVDSYVYNDTHLLNINNKGFKVRT